MVQRRATIAARLLVVGVVLLLTPALAGRAENQTLVLTGSVSIERIGTDSTRVSIIERGYEAPAHSFLIQHQASFPVQTGNGGGRVIFKGNLLIVSLEDGTGWVGAVDTQRLAPGGLPASASNYPIYDVFGLAHYWPKGTRGPGTAAPQRARVKPMSEESPNCKECADGGEGSTACSLTCATGRCSVTCSTGYFACCKCETVPLCRCCKIGG
jgi:hypothetical protein